MWVCQDDRQLPAYLNYKMPISALCVYRPTTFTPTTHPFGIPAVTCELPPLISALFSSRSEPLISLWVNLCGQGGPRVWRGNLKQLFFWRGFPNPSVLHCGACLYHSDHVASMTKQSRLLLYFPKSRCWNTPTETPAGRMPSWTEPPDTSFCSDPQTPAPSPHAESLDLAAHQFMTVLTSHINLLFVSIVASTDGSAAEPS